MGRQSGRLGAVIRFILGTRPEALKILPVLRVLTARKAAFDVLCTGQHTDLLAGTGLLVARSLNLPSDNDPLAYVQAVRQALDELHVQHTDWVVVQGDTASARAGAQYATDHLLELAHIEAGLRSGDFSDPWPEEMFRVEIDNVADYKFCPTMRNLRHLEAEDLADGAHVTGNTIVDQLRAMKVQREPGSHVLITLHRREAFGEPLKAILEGLSRVAREYPDTPFLWPVHPNPHVRDALEATALPVNVLTRDPLPYHSFLTLLASAKAVLTDSGGVVEEACTLGVPTVIARDHTERPEALGHSALLAGKTADGVESALVQSFTRSCEPSEVFGDGHASERIADLLSA